jgi:BolA family transcriptional regulator, general stress-responsive regulator
MPHSADTTDTRIARLNALLTEAFSPVSLTITDDSDRHIGHAGAQPGGETHYRVEIVAAAFARLSRVQMQRAVMLVLEAEFDSGLHALSLKASPPPPEG